MPINNCQVKNVSAAIAQICAGTDDLSNDKRDFLKCAATARMQPHQTRTANSQRRGDAKGSLVASAAPNSRRSGVQKTPLLIAPITQGRENVSNVKQCTLV